MSNRKPGRYSLRYRRWVKQRVARYNHMGFVYIQSGNAKRDYDQALEKLIRDKSDSFHNCIATGFFIRYFELPKE